MEIKVDFVIADIHLRNRFIRLFGSDYNVRVILDNGEYISMKVLVARSVEDILEAVQRSLKKRLFQNIRYMEECQKSQFESSLDFYKRIEGLRLRFEGVGQHGQVTVNIPGCS